MTRVPNKSSLTTSNYNRSSLPDSMADDFNVTYDIGDLGQLDFDYDNDLRTKYPALKDAWDHYNNVKQLCESKEKEEDEN
jgi:hypothetical protein